MGLEADIFNPFIIALSIIILGIVCLVLIVLVFIFAILFWRNKESVEKNAHKHYLSGLPNRIAMNKALEKILTDTNKTIALLFIDIDDFHSINNSLGNKVGDKLLLNISKVIKEVAVKYTKYIYQIGSDEFAVILMDCGKEMNPVIEIANQIIEQIAKPTNIDGYELHSSCAVGICSYPECAKDADSLLSNASAAKDNAKKKGYGSYSVYTADMSKKANMRTLISGDLREALERDEFFLNYQPMVNTLDGRVTGVEALLRWRHNSLGNITPDIFVPVIEELGLIHSIGKWVISTACKEISKLNAAGFPELSVSINISAHQFNRGDIATVIAESIWDTGINPKNVVLELTEAVVMNDTEKSVLMLNVLRSMGVKIAVDDFGTGYSSMNQLTKFPISILKIDRCFIHDLDKNNTNLAIVTTMIKMGKQLGFTVVAEGVENKEELDILRHEECDLIQGFYYSKPLSFADLKQFLQNNDVSRISSA